MTTSGLWNINRPQPWAQGSYIPLSLIGHGISIT